MVDWTVARALQVLALFLLAGLAEIGGGWLVWKAPCSPRLTLLKLGPGPGGGHGLQAIGETRAMW